MIKINLKIQRKDLTSLYLPIAALIVVFFLSKNFLFIQINKLIQEKRELDKNLQEGELLKTKASFLQGLDKTELEENVEKANKTLPFNKDITSILNALDYLMTVNGVVITDFNLKPGLISTISAKPVEKKEVFFDFPFSISVAGNTLAVEAFIDGINKSARLFKITSVAAEYQQETRVALNLVTFYLPQPKEMGKISTPLKSLSSSQLKVLDQISQLKSAPSLTLVTEKESTPSSRKNLFSF